LNFKKLVGLVSLLEISLDDTKSKRIGEVIFATSCRSLDFTKLVGLAFLLEISLHDTKSKHMFVK
jgi:hypothetical protein